MKVHSCGSGLQGTTRVGGGDFELRGGGRKHRRVPGGSGRERASGGTGKPGGMGISGSSGSTGFTVIEGGEGLQGSTWGLKNGKFWGNGRNCVLVIGSFCGKGFAWCLKYGCFEKNVFGEMLFTKGKFLSLMLKFVESLVPITLW